MPRYDFTSLSSQDFEELVRDLLQAEWNVPLEAFKAGRDRGIDLRYSPSDSGKTIIQCKHYAASGFGKLLSHLRHCERPKVERLDPKRYIVATSVGLTPGNKEDIAQALQPFVLNASDILGADDLEGLLSRHPDVERANFKLWLTSTGVIDRVLHNAELCQTEFEVRRIRRKLPLFVQSDAFPRAMELLERERIAVISGVPGIGKSTLAEILLYAHLERGYVPVVIQAEVNEGKKLFKADAKQIFYYDDFLGQTFLGDRSEYLGRNQDAAITDFMEMVQQSPHARFILTTREHILRSALQVSERLARNPMLEHRCVLEMRDYSYADKARILYNHLYFSDLSRPYKEAILKSEFFLDVVKHEHYNPRLIEWLSSLARVRTVAPTEYPAYIAQLLQSPDEIWAHAFRNQISNAARDALVALYTLGEWIDVIDLEPAFMSLHRNRAWKYHQTIAPGDFHTSLQELDGAFLSYGSGHVHYVNPSIREFIASVISGERETVDDLLASAVRFKQVVNVWRLATARPSSDLSLYLKASEHLLRESLSRLLRSPTTRWEKGRDGSTRGYPIDLDVEAKIAFLVEVAETERSIQFDKLIAQAADLLVAEWDHYVVTFASVLRLLEKIGANSWCLARGGRETYRKLLDGVLQGLPFARATDWIELLSFPEKAMEWSEEDQRKLSSRAAEYLNSGVREERYACTTLDEMMELRASLAQLSCAYGIDVGSEIERLDQEIDEREDSDDSPREGNGLSAAAMTPRQETATDEDVKQMFSTLLAND